METNVSKEGILKFEALAMRKSIFTQVRVLREDEVSTQFNETWVLGRVSHDNGEWVLLTSSDGKALLRVMVYHLFDWMLGRVPPNNKFSAVEQHEVQRRALWSWAQSLPQIFLK